MTIHSLCMCLIPPETRTWISIQHRLACVRDPDVSLSQLVCLGVKKASPKTADLF